MSLGGNCSLMAHRFHYGIVRNNNGEWLESRVIVVLTVVLHTARIMGCLHLKEFVALGKKRGDIFFAQGKENTPPRPVEIGCLIEQPLWSIPIAVARQFAL